MKSMASVIRKKAVKSSSIERSKEIVSVVPRSEIDILNTRLAAVLEMNKNERNKGLNELFKGGLK